ncbi:MAG: LysR family transcriptional regulator [Proteobacteria bacterium]|nr:MAG: LysR family transcriptional regulator [Pseudomonadota bacterium]
MDIDAISVFVKVVESGSFSGAARLLRMPKTTVSARVAGLEKRLGVTLIQRTTRRLHITEAGQTYFRHCAAAIKEIELGEASLLAGRDHPNGLLRITAPIDFGHSLLPRLVSEFLRIYPDVQVELIVTNRVVDLVGEGIDLAIRVGELKDSTLLAKKFFEVNFAFCATPEYIAKFGSPKDPNDIANYQVLMHTAMRSKAIELTDGKNFQTIFTHARVDADEIQTIKALTLQNLGIGWLPAFLVAEEMKAKTLIRILPRWWIPIQGNYYFVYPGQKYSSPNVKAFVELAMEQVQKEKGK